MNKKDKLPPLICIRQPKRCERYFTKNISNRVRKTITPSDNCLLDGNGNNLTDGNNNCILYL